MEEESLVLAVSSIDFLNFSEKARLLKELKKIGSGDLGAALEFLSQATYGQVAEISGRDLRRRLGTNAWNPALLVRRAKAGGAVCKTLGIKIALFGDPDYPPPLDEIYDPPFALFYRGDIKALFEKNVSVVGTRSLAPDGKKAAHDFSYQAAAAGFCVVSGLAWGADGWAHKGAIDAFFEKRTRGVKTAAVLAGGVDNIFPPSHKGIAKTIIQNGGVILSECPPGVPAEKWRFVQRNRIIAALSPGTLVVQAPPGSGAMITADFALGYNRELFFHEACFSKEAKTLSDMVFKRLMARSGAAAQKKIEFRPEKYVLDGAKVVKNFDDFIKMLVL